MHDSVGPDAEPGVRKGGMPAAPSARGITDVTRIADLRHSAENKLASLRRALPTAMSLLSCHGWVSTARLHPYVVVDIVESIRYMEDILAHMRATAAEGNHTEQGRAFEQAINEDSLDKTFANLVVTGALEGHMGTLELVYGIPPVNILVMAAARLYYSPSESRASRALREACHNANFLNAQGELSIVDPAGAISKALGQARRTHADCNWDTSTRSLIRNIAQACRMTVVVYDDKGKRHDWNEKAGAEVRAMNARGQRQLYTEEELVAISTWLDTFARLRGKEAAAVEAVKTAALGSIASAAPAAFYGGHDVLTCPDVFIAANYREPCVSCGHVFPANRSICVVCSAARPSYICHYYDMPTPEGYDLCVNSLSNGCPGTRAGGRQPEAGELQKLAS